LTDGSTVDTDNTQWTVNIVGGGTGYGASVSRLQLTRVVIDDISEGGSVAFINKPQLMKLTYNGLETTTYDTLTLGTGSRSFPTSNSDTTTTDQSYVRLSSSLTAPFQFSDTNTNTVYYVVDGNPTGSSAMGTIFYQNTNGYFTPYFSSASGYQSNGTVDITNNTLVTFGTGPTLRPSPPRTSRTWQDAPSTEAPTSPSTPRQRFTWTGADHRKQV